MPRPKTKQELLTASEQNFTKLLAWIDALTDSERDQIFPEGYLNRNIRDVLAHLHEWHLMVMLWEKKGAAGQQVDMPAPGYTWRTLPELNKQIWTTYRDVPLQEIRALVKASHKQVQDLVRGYHGEQLFKKKVYKWTGSTSVAAYLISATSSHYDWALKLIKKCLSRK